MNRIYKRLITITALVVIVNYTWAQNKTSKPNIVLIMVDDMGYSDIGAYGSEIQTPNLDRLAAEGTRLKEFYNNSICAPTRASLLTGQYPHRAGIGYFDVNLGLPPYQGYLNKESLTLGEVLKQNGYSTLLSGKWHVGQDSLAWPRQRGFDQFYGIIGGASDYFDVKPMPFGNNPSPVTLLRNNTRQYPKDDSYYFTDEIGNNAVQFLDEQNKENKPFFLYVAFTAPHWPLQALPEDIAKYKGKYDIGWDSLRKQRLERQRQLGIIEPTQKVSDRDSEVPYWNKLTYDEKQFWKAKMEVYAAMLDRMDQNVGKILDKLKALKKDDNTLIIFISDNGAQGGFSSFNQNRKGQVRNTGPVGTSGSFDYQEQSWAYVSNTPLRQYKNNFHEGGFGSPFIAWYPKQIKAGSITKGTAHLIDLAPTFYELTGTKYPVKYNGITINALAGKSLLPVLTGKVAQVERGEPLFWERAGNRAVRKGKWKIVSTYPSLKWELYDIETDRGETKDLSAERTDVVNELSADYFKWAERTGVVDYERIKPAGGFNIPGVEGSGSQRPGQAK